MTANRQECFGLIKRFMQLVVLFSGAALLTYLIEMGADKQQIRPLQNYDSLLTFATIIGKNSLVFLALLSSAFSGNKIKDVIGCLFALANGCVVGALIARFPTLEYCVLLAPHGILEMSSFFLLLGAVSTTHLRPRGRFPQRLLLLAGVSYAMLLGAAWIEAFITPFLAVSYLL